MIIEHVYRLITQKSYFIELPGGTDELNVVCVFQYVLIEIGDIQCNIAAKNKKDEKCACIHKYKRRKKKQHKRR